MADGMVVMVVAQLSVPSDPGCVATPLVVLYHPIIGWDGLSFSCLLS